LCNFTGEGFRTKTKATTPPNKDGTPIWVSTTPHTPNGEEVGEEREGEEKSSKSPSFAEVLKKDLCPSPPLTRGRRSNKENREKEVESRILSGSQQTLDDFAFSEG
jgi:hypothetical protein